MAMNAAPTFSACIWIAGDYREAVQACREFCRSNPLCVTITPTDFVYTNGAEAGICIRLINYPRFPKTADEIKAQARALAAFLMPRLCQWSYTVEFADDTEWYSERSQ